jgi:hypothetical protein
VTRAARAVLAVALAVALGGCGYKLIPAKPRSIGKAYTVHPQIEWSGKKDGDVELWTVHGPRLEAVRFVIALEAGEGILEPELFSDEEFPEFQPDMSPTEIAEFCVDTLSRMGAKRPRTSGLRPEPFGPHPGFAFDLEFSTANGLEMSGLAAGAVVEEKLHLILFTAPRTHYFESRAPDVERIIESITFR